MTPKQTETRKFFGLGRELRVIGTSALEMDRQRFERLPPDKQEAWLFLSRHQLKPGDEHPSRKGWYLTDQIGLDDVPLWYKPPSLISIVIGYAARTISVIAVLGIIIGFLVIGAG